VRCLLEMGGVEQLRLWAGKRLQLPTVLNAHDKRDVAATILPLIRHCVQLTELDLANCGLSKLPPSFGSLSELKELDLSRNALTLNFSAADNELGLVELCKLKKLARLKLSHQANGALAQLAQLSEEQGAQAALAFIRDACDDPHRSYRLKLVLGGPSCAGKSSLLRALLGHDERLTRKDERTIGLETARLLIPDARCAPEAGVHFFCYDAGGHDEYHEMLQWTFTGDGTLYVLIYNVSCPDASLRQLTRWATLIATCAPGASVVLVSKRLLL
jgi:hypothetical protein